MRGDEDILAIARRISGAIVPLILALALSSCAETKKAPANPPPAANAIDETRLQGYFESMDQDGDGVVSRPEFEGERGAVFLAIDKNNSLFLTADEMHLSPEAFAKLAGDDGIVVPGEFSNTDIASFEKVDANRDLQLSYEEVHDFVLPFGL
ncbi:MAG TPA: hypothetical protein VFE34_04955 [Dongiaceae bacterium]|jgi:hypothetical protein|nr:hypothetical protein [Dongiaceae bacterium]